MNLIYKVVGSSVVLQIQAINASGQPVQGAWEMGTPVWSSDDTVGNVTLKPGPDASDQVNPLAETECLVTPKAGVWPKVLLRANAIIDLRDGNGPQPKSADLVVQFVDPNAPVGIALVPKPTVK